MTSELHGIARLAGATRAAEPAAGAPAGAGGFVTTVQRAKDVPAFETVVKSAAAEQSARAGQPTTAGAAPASTAPGAPLSTPGMSPTAKAAKAQKSFESFALQTFIGSMLPKENNKMFGTGNAGKMWQSLLAEKLADQISASGRLKLLPQQQGSVAATSAPGAAAAPTSGVAAPVAAATAPEAAKKQQVAGGMTPEALQAIVGSLKTARSGGTR